MLFLRNVAVAWGESNVFEASTGACHKRDDLSHFSPLEEELSFALWSEASETAQLFSKEKARPDLLRCAILGRAYSRNTKRLVEKVAERSVFFLALFFVWFLFLFLLLFLFLFLFWLT